MRRNICIACMLLLYFDCFIRSKDQVFVPPVYFGISCYFFRYKVGHHFGWHVDGSVNLGDGKCTHYTLLIYLSGANKAKTKTDPNSQMDSSSEPLVGGETVFYGSRNSVLADVNSLHFIFINLFFPSRAFHLCFFNNLFLLFFALWMSLSFYLIKCTQSWLLLFPSVLCRWLLLKGWFSYIFMGTSVCCMKLGMLLRVWNTFSVQMHVLLESL